MNHVASPLGCLLLVHGGCNNQPGEVNADFNLFDMKLNEWIRCVVAPNNLDKGELHKITQVDYSKPLNSNATSKCIIPARKMHVMEAVGLENIDQHERYNWVVKQTRSQGFWMFGGQDENGVMHNDLWHIEPFYEENRRLLTSEDQEFVSPKPALCLNLSQARDFSGQPPCPRILAASCVLRNAQGEHLFVIYGGRNDQIFGGTKNVALNDVNIFNTVTRHWSSLAMYGIIPSSRWAHIIVPNRQHYSDGFIVLGGINLNSYCCTKLTTF